MRGSIEKKLTFFMLMWIIFVSLWPLFSQAEKKGLDLIKKGEALYKKTKYEEAMEKFEEAGNYIYTETNRLRLYKNISRVNYALGKEKESLVYILKVFEINENARLLRDKIVPKYKALFLGTRHDLKKLISKVKDLVDRKLFSKARQELEKAVKFKGHKKVEELENYIKEAEKKYKEK